MDMSVIDALIDKVRDGTDYNIAKLFVSVFPDCSSFTEKDISIKLSEDICTLLQQHIPHLHRKKYDPSAGKHTQLQISNEIKEYENVIIALRTHNKKKQFIAEIKSIR